MTQRPQPEGLGTAGASLWDAVAGVLALDEHEAVALRELCRTADVLDELQAVVDRDGPLQDSPHGQKAHPALTELRAQRITYARLVSALRLPAGLTDRKQKKEAQGEAGRVQRRPGTRGVYAINGGQA